jgi:CRISPR/Cas system-associated endoribonuclease Cas2
MFMRYLVLYDISDKIDRYGLRVRMVRELRRIKGINIQRSTWILPEITEKLKSLMLEAENIGAKVIVNKYEPIRFYEGFSIGFVKSPSFKDHDFLRETRKAFPEKDFKLKEKSYGKSSEYRMPSEAINALYGEGVDLVVFITNAKNMESAMYMGYEVLNNSYLLSDSTAFVEMVKIEDLNKYVVVSWTRTPPQISSILSSKLGLDVIKGSSPPQELMTIEGEFAYRRVFGVSPGEEIYIEEIPVAKAKSESIVIVSHRGHIVDMMGASLYAEKIKGLGKIKLEKAIVKSFKTSS